MEHVITKLGKHLIDLNQAKTLSEKAINNPKTTSEVKQATREMLEVILSQIQQTESAIELLSKRSEKQCQYWDEVESIIEKRPRNSMGTALAYLSEIFLLIKK